MRLSAIRRDHFGSQVGNKILKLRRISWIAFQERSMSLKKQLSGHFLVRNTRFQGAEVCGVVRRNILDALKEPIQPQSPNGLQHAAAAPRYLKNASFLSQL